MEEADEIILGCFREVGGLTTSTTKISEIDANVLVKCVGMGLHKVMAIVGADGGHDQGDFVTVLPSNVSQRHRECAKLARGLKAHGYMKECGYNQLLYPSEKSTRDILSWLADLLTKVVEESKDAKRSEEEEKKRRKKSGKVKSSTLIRMAMERWVQDTWVVPFQGVKNAIRKPFLTCNLAEEKEEEGQYAHFVTYQCGKQRRMIAPSLLEANRLACLQNSSSSSSSLSSSLLDEPYSPLHVDEGSRKTMISTVMSQILNQTGGESGPSNSSGKNEPERKQQQQQQTTSLKEVLKSYELKAQPKTVPLKEEGVFARAAKYGHESAYSQDATKEPQSAKEEIGAQDLKPDLENLVNELQKELQVIQEELSEAEAAIRTNMNREEEAREMLQKIFAEQETLEETYGVRKSVLDMAPESKANIDKLKQIVQDSKRRMEELKQEWDQHKSPLLEELEMLRNEEYDLRAGSERKLAEAKRMRSELRSMASQIKSQQDREQALEAAYAKLPRNINRTMYTKRILDIIKQVEKQNAEIDRVIEDIRLIQVDINQVSEKLMRTEAVTDDLVFHISDGQKQDPSAVQAYRYLHDMRVLFDELIELAKMIGKATNKAREFGSRSENLKQRVNNENVEQLTQDLQEIRKENKELKQQYKQLKLASSS